MAKFLGRASDDPASILTRRVRCPKLKHTDYLIRLSRRDAKKLEGWGTERRKIEIEAAENKARSLFLIHLADGEKFRPVYGGECGIRTHDTR